MGTDVDAAADRESVELRTECPREIVDVLDAISAAHRLTRGQLIVRVLGEWARDRLHEHSLISRVRRGNPTDLASDGKGRG